MSRYTKGKGISWRHVQKWLVISRYPTLAIVISPQEKEKGDDY
jgi:hypothetical protein